MGKLKRANLLLILFGIGLAVLLIGGAFLLFPQLRWQLRAQTISFTVGIGDMFFNRPGLIAPPPNPDEILSQHPIVYDDDGFRAPERPAWRYDIVALGDSYTEAANSARPWTDVLAAESGLAVLNLGFRGYGPVQELRVLLDYGLNRGANTIIVGFFEGNDLSNVVDNTEYREPRIERAEFPPFDPTVQMWHTDNPGPFQLPIGIEINGIITEMALLDAYLSWLNAPSDDYTQSGNMNALREVWVDMEIAADEMCIVIAYFPTPPHIYAPYIVQEDRERFMATVESLAISAPGGMLTGQGAGSITYAESMNRLNNQRDAIAALAADMDLPFIDLVPAFEEAAARGEILYYAYDTHWNQAGHDLAGRVIADFLGQFPEPCSRR